MRSPGGTTLAAAFIAAIAVVGCSTGGGPVPASVTDSATTAATGAASTTTRPATTKPSAPTTSSEAFELPAYGVEPTTRTPLAPNADTCPADNTGNVTFGATVADPAAPALVIGVPNGFLPTSGTSDVAVSMAGPEAMSAQVTIVATELDAEAAFKKYADDVTADKEFSSISVLPGDLCGYSGQRLMGSVADQPGKAVEFRDRIVHVWTNTKDYLVAIHLQGPTGVAGFDAVEAVLMADFGIRIP